MPKYHDQELIKERIDQIISTASLHEQQNFIKTMKALRKTAQEDVSKIDSCTAPEERERRHNILNYYDDMIEGLE
jgi:hypothetical protein